MRLNQQHIDMILYMKGLNKDAKMRIELEKMGKMLERRLNNPHLKINKK